MADMQPINDIYDSYHSNYRWEILIPVVYSAACFRAKKAAPYTTHPLFRDWNSAAQKYFNFMVNARGMDEDDFQWDI